LCPTWRDTNPNCNSYSDCDGHVHADRYSHTNRDANAYPNCDTMHGEMYTHAQAAPDASAQAKLARSRRILFSQQEKNDETNQSFG